MITQIPVSSITVLPGRRRLDPAWVETLAGMMDTPSDCSPIEVVTAGTGYELVFGGHRLAAAQRKGWSAIPGIVKERSAFANEAAIRLREIAENLIRRELSVLDRAVDIAAWRDIYEAAHGTARPGRKAAARTEADDLELSARFALNFTEAAQQALKISRRSVFLALKVASIAADVRNRIALHPIADNQAELLQMAAEPSNRQAQIADILLSEPAPANTVAGAVAIMDRLPAKQRKESWEKLSKAFSSLKPKDQDRFFELHEAAIERWLRGRSS